MKRNKLYRKRESDKDGKLYFIFCEGEVRETTYFFFFNRLASQIIIQIVPISNGKNSPMGLFNIACERLLRSSKNPNPEYELNDEDEVWFIVDTDKWGQAILQLRDSIKKFNNWFIAQSNPSFEVWLYYHFKENKPKGLIENWKQFLNDTVRGGFNCSKHPVYVEDAIANSTVNYSATNGQPDIATTEVFELAKKFLPLVKSELDILKHKGT